MKHTSFFYSYWTKFLGLIIIVVAIIGFFLRNSKAGNFDFNELSMGLSWGFVFILFSKEKNDDEMMQGLKFKALSRAVIVAFIITHLYNYIFLNWNFTQEHDIILSISAYQFLALTLIIAILSFYYLKYRATLNEAQ